MTLRPFHRTPPFVPLTLGVLPAVVTALLLLMAAFAPPAQGQLTSRGVVLISTAGGGPAFVRDNDALFLNPANIAFDDRPARFLLTVADAQTFSGGNLLQYGYYNDYFTTGRTLTSADKTALLDGWFGDGERRAGAQADLVPVALTYRSPTNHWAVGGAFRLRNRAQVSLNRGLLDLFLFGTSPDRTVPLNGTVTAQSVADLTVAYGVYLPRYRVAVGIAPRLVLGLTHAEAEMTSTFTTSQDRLTHTFDYTVRSAGSLNSRLIDDINFFDRNPVEDVDFRLGGIAGTGFGLDFGITYSPRYDLLVALSFTDLGMVTWRSDAVQITPVQHTFVFEGIELNRATLDDDFGGNLGDYTEHVLDSLARGAYEEVERLRGEAFTTTLPATVHLGGAWYRGRAVINGGLRLALNDAPGNLSRVPVLHVGAELRLGLVPIRAGVKVGGEGAPTFGFGVGLNTRVYDFNVGFSATPVSGAGARYSIGLSMFTFRF